VWFGPLGAVLGAAVGLVWWGAARVMPAVVAAGLAVAADLLLTGFLHLDGLADSADGLLPPLHRDRRLQIMSQPDVGAFGVGAVVVVVGLRWSALASLSSTHAALIAGLWALSRSAMAATLGAVRYARPGGLAELFRSPGHALASVAVGLPLGFGLVAWGAGWRGLAAGGVGLGAGAGVVQLARRRLGGFTGDVLGAVGLVVETVGLVALTTHG
jgi:adenosylcobinamide-GDP ribazoletransferase